MKRSPGDVVRRVLSVAAVVALTSVSACGGGRSDDAGGSSASPSSSPSVSASAGSGVGEPGAAADGKCGGGEFETKVVKAARGVSLRVPADWKVESAKGGAAIRFYPPDPDLGDGYLVVRPSQQSLEEVIDEDQQATRDSAEVTSETDLDLSGLDAARLTTFRYSEDLDGAFSVNLAAVGDGLRVLANMTRDRDEAEQAAAESCLSSVAIVP